MNRRRPIILIGQLSKESHSFSPVKTNASDFMVERGQDLVERNQSTRSKLSGFISAARRRNAHLIPALSAFARPGGPVVQTFYDEFKSEFCKIARAGGFDGIALDLHGAMLTEKLDDPEGDLLEALRLIVGEQIPIAAGFDLHGHMTSQILKNADFCTAYKENPHSDIFETGERTFNCLLDIIEGKINPVTALGKVPMLTRGNDETTVGPLRGLQEYARVLQKKDPSIIDISIFNVHPFLDVPDLGQAVVAVSNGDPKLAGETVTDICGRLWGLRDDLVDHYPSIAQTIKRIIEERDKGPYVLGDMGDRVLGTAPGDSTAILRYMLENDTPLRAAIPITDPNAVDAAVDAGVGAKITLKVGGRFTPSFDPVEVTGVVLYLGDGEYIFQGPFQAGVRGRLGRTAVLQVKNIFLLLTAKSGPTQDPAAFSSQGINIKDLDYVVVKSGNHFKISFAGIAVPINVDTPGLSVFRPSEFPFRQARPFYPLDQIDYSPTKVSIFTGRRFEFSK